MCRPLIRNDDVFRDAEKIFWFLYMFLNDVRTCDNSRAILLYKGRSQEILTPTSDDV